MNRFLALCFASPLALLAGCSPGATDSASGPVEKRAKPEVHTVNYPLAYFAERIGGGHVDAVFNCPAGEDPAFWEPSDANIAAFQKADLILLNGATYAKWIDHVSLPASISVDTSQAFQEQFIASESHITHSHGKDGEHSHSGTAFTTWLDFTLAAKHASAVRDALKRILPERAPDFDATAAALEKDLLALDTDMAALGKKLNNQPLLASHPIYQYLAHRYGLNLQSVLWEPGIHPPAEEWANLDNVLVNHPAKLMLWEGEPHPDTAAALAERGITPVIFSQAGNRPAAGDFLSVMRAGIENLKEALQ